MIIGKAPRQIPEFMQECQHQQLHYNDIFIPEGLSAQVAWTLYKLPHKTRRRILRKGFRAVVKRFGHNKVTKGVLNETLSNMLGITGSSRMR
jgi:hypothetical protein